MHHNQHKIKENSRCINPLLSVSLVADIMFIYKLTIYHNLCDKITKRNRRINSEIVRRRTYREITPIVHCSPNQISKVQRKITSERNEPNILIKNKSTCALVFDCLMKKMPLTQIVKDLDIEHEKVKNFHKEFLLLQNKDNLVRIFDKDKDYQDGLLKIHDYLTINNIDIEQVYSKINSEKLNEIQEENAYLEVTNFNNRESTKYWELEYRNLKKEYEKLLDDFLKLQIAC